LYTTMEKRLVHQSIVHKLLPMTTTRKVWSPPAAAYSLHSISQSINLEYEIAKATKWTKT